MKIIELYVTEEDDGSGVDALSLVENPATHYKWEIFEDETECNGECQLTQHFSDKGEELQYFFSNTEGFKVENLTPEEFYTIQSNPKVISNADDTATEVVRYYYAVDVGLGPTLIKESRKLCRQLIRKDLVYTTEDLVTLSGQLTSDGESYKLVPRTRGTTVDLKTYKSGKFCRHLLKKIVWKIPQGVTPAEFVSKIPKRAKTAISSNIGEGRPTVELQPGRGGISEYKIYMNSQDGAIGLLEGLVVYSSPKALFEGEPDATAICEIEFEGVRGFIGGIPENENYFNEDVKVIHGVKMEEFESYDDYPKAASDAACKVLRWRDEHGDEVQGMGRIGWTRANQLCSKSPISEETIARMASFARHRKNAEISEEYKGTPWKDKGYVAWLGWGDTAGIEWAQRKLKQIQEELTKRYEYRMGCVQGYLDKGYGEEESRMKCYEEQYPWTDQYPDNVLPLSQNFADELNYEVTTVVMEPNRYIARRDEIGEIYYVFFSEDTIKKMARKFFKQDRHKSFNYEHSGLKLNGGYVYESWIVDDPEMDKATKMGFKVNKGTWMATIKWDNKQMFEKYVLSNKTTGISLEGNFLSRPGNLNTTKMEKIGELDGLPIFDNAEEARKYGLEKYGCVGVHQHRPGEFMPCEAHDVLINVTNSLYNNDDEVFIDEIKTIINNFYKSQK